MATRRPRVKPTAILKPRRAQSSSNPEPSTTSLKSENIDIDAKFTVNIILESENASEIDATATKNHEIDVKPIPQNIDREQPQTVTGPDKVCKVENEIGSKSAINESNKSNASADKPLRRIITPTVNIVGRRKNVATENRPFNHASPVHMKSPVYSYRYESNAAASPTRKTDEKSFLSIKHGGTTNEDEVFSPVPENDECFKSPPFMSPSIYSRRPEPSISPYIDGYHEDYTKSPSSINSSKMRQRIRPTPCFGNRRNSIQGASESEDDTGRRQRHFSTSSNQSSYNFAGTPQPQRNYFSLNKTYSRIRTESLCSNVSDAASQRDYSSRPKRSHRSEEFQRVANAKREFNQRLNGKPPDKSRLTMYDMIYYNPLTNPMTKPAVKSESKDRTDCVSVSSIKTMQSRSSVKSEPKVKAENTDSNQEAMPVPQLKLGPNGEIILDEKSLVIETTGDKEAREMLANSDIIYDDEFSGTSGFYKRHKRTRDWPPEETIKFYRSLQTIGTDFSVMLQLFPNRSRRDLKLKFKKEEKHNMALINKALLHPKEFNVEELKLQFDKEDKDLEVKKAEWAELAQKMARERKEQLKITKKRASKKVLSTTARSLTNGDTLYENEFVIPPRRKRQFIRQKSMETLAVNGDQVQSSPYSNAHNNNIDSPINSPTYATHKLPSFTEMISSQKSSNRYYQNGQNIDKYQSHESNITNRNNNSNNNNNNNVVKLDKEKIFNRTTVSATILDNSATSSINTTDPLYNDTLIQRYIAKNPNLSFKTDSDDIMNMDIIFDNVPIEEDPTITNNNSGVAAAAVDNVVLNSVPDNSKSSTSNHTIQNVHIQGQNYEIITLNDNDRCRQSQHSGELNDVNSENQCADSINSPDTIVVLDRNNDNIEYNEFIISSENVVIMSSELDETINLHPANQLNTNISDNNWQTPVPGATESVETVKCSDPSELIKPTQITNGNDSNAQRKSTESAQEAIESVLPEINDSLTEPYETNATQIKTEQIKSVAKEAQPNQVDNVLPSISLKRKRKPLPMLVGRTKKLKAITPEINDQTPEISNSTCNVPDTVQPHSIEPVNSIHEQQKCNTNPSMPSPTFKIELKNETADADDIDPAESSEETNFMDSLVVVESQDPIDSNKTIHEVYVVCPKTKVMSEQPLDLPDEVIQRIRLSMMPE